MSWWEDNPARLQYELDYLDHLNIGHEEICEPGAEEAYKLKLSLNVGGVSFTLRVEFPEAYPSFRPRVYMLEGPALERHYSFITKEICLLGPAHDLWDPQKDSLAKLLIEQLPKVLSNQDVDSDEWVDDYPQGEPYSTQLGFLDRSSLLIPFDLPTVETEKGKLEIAVLEKDPFRGVVTSILDGNNNQIFDIPDWVKNLAKGKKKLSCRWHRTSISGLSSREAFNKITLNNRSSIRHTNIIAALVEEETQHGISGWSWVITKCSTIKRKNKVRLKGYFVNPSLVSKRSRFERAPELQNLSSKSALIVGLGMIGSPLTLEMAQAGFNKLYLLDKDYVDGATAVRWAGGAEFSGWQKTNALQERIAAAYPWVTVTPIQCSVGDPHNQSNPVSEQDIKNIIDGVDIVIDCTAEHSVSDYLNELCHLHNTAFISLVTTPGNWGGFIVKSLPSEPGCWACAKFRQNDKSDPLGFPSGDSSGEIQPLGCAMPTVHGNGFDSSIVSNMATRLAVSTVLGGVNEYPDLGWDIAVLHLRDHSGNPVPPNWQTETHTVHANCDICNGD